MVSIVLALSTGFQNGNEINICSAEAREESLLRRSSIHSNGLRTLKEQVSIIRSGAFTMYNGINSIAN